MPRPCLSPLSNTASKFLFSEKVLGQYEACYFFDPDARYIFVDEPTWLDKAYSDAIAQTDTGILGRNLRNADLVCRLLNETSELQGPYVDLGGGYGLFVRRMRDCGHDFYWSDKYAENLLARGFEAAPGEYDLAVAFEVLEHLRDPLGFIVEAQEQYHFKAFLFSATCFDPENIPAKEWWYWAFETGQHISFFSLDTLEWLGARLGMRLTWLTADLFILTRGIESDLAAACRRSLLERVVNRASSYLRPKPQNVCSSLTFSDHLEIRRRLRMRADTKIKA